MIALTCPHCGQKLQVKDEYAGRLVKCPGCQKAVQLMPALPAGAATAAPRAANLAEDGTLPPQYPARTIPPPLPGSNSTAVAPSERQAEVCASTRYAVHGEIGRGGMGAVVKAVDQDIRREVAVKYLLDQSDERQKARFLEEARITGQLEHPNIVPIHQLGVDGDSRFFFSMKMVKGRSLAQILDELRTPGESGSVSAGSAAFTLGRLLNIFVNICNALAYAHTRGVIHRDLKPANIMVGDFGETYVMDWGLAKVRNQDSGAWGQESGVGSQRTEAPRSTSNSCSVTSGNVLTSRVQESELTQDGTILGTLLYMPPEQARGEIALLDQRSDIYSLGAILYEILTLTPPVGRGDKMEVLSRVVEGTIDPPEQRAPNRARQGLVPPELSAISLKALALKPDDRYQRVEALQRDIQLFLEGRSVSAKPDSFREMVWKLVKRNKGASAATGIGLLLLIAVLAVSFRFINAARVRAEEERNKAEAARNKANENYQAYLDQVKVSVPAFLRAAKLALKERQYDDALAQVSVAAKAAPEEAEIRLLRAKLLITRQRFAEALPDLEKYLNDNPDSAITRKLAELCRKRQAEKAAAQVDKDMLLAFAEVFDEGQDYDLADGVLSSLGENARLEMYKKRLGPAWSGGLTMLGAGSYSLHMQDMNVTDLAPLRGIPFTSLNLGNNPGIRDLAPLRGMPLTSLRIGLAAPGGGIQDLKPLKGMHLINLIVSCRTQVRDLEPLRGMPLRVLRIRDTGVTDLRPLQGMQLDEIWLTEKNITQGLDILRNMKSLFRINGMGAKDFWMRYDNAG